MVDQGLIAGKVALITGAGRGIGRSVAAALAARGAIIAANDITPVNLDITLKHIQERGGQVRDYIADISKSIPVQTMLDQILGDFGRIDILVNHAFVHPQASLVDFDDWHWRRAIDVNLNGAFLLTQLVGKTMIGQGGGVIVHVAGKSTMEYGEGQTAFTASMAGLIALTRSAAQEFAEYQVRVHAVCPWIKFQVQVPPDEAGSSNGSIVDLVVFLCSQPAAQISGLVIDSLIV